MRARMVSARSLLAGAAVLAAALAIAGCTSTMPTGGGDRLEVAAEGRTAVNTTAPATPEAPESQSTTMAGEWREVWQEHATWSRAVMLGVMNEVPGATQASEHLDRNASDMEELLTPVAGRSRAQRFGALVREHAEIEAAMLRAMKADDAEAAASAEKEWYANGYAVAALMNKMAPGIELEVIDGMFKDHLAATKQEAEDRMAGDFAADITSHDRVQRQVRGMADATSEALLTTPPGESQ